MRIRAASAFASPRAVVLVTALGMVACGDSDGSLAPPAERVATRIEALTSTSLNGTVGTELSPTPAVRVVDAEGRPVQGVVISFVPGSGAGIISHTVAVTDDEGVATVGKWTLGPWAGTQRLTVRFADGRAGVVFTVAAQPGPLARLTPYAGNDQIARPGARLLQPLVVYAGDEFGNPIAGASVTFAVTSGDGSIDSSVTLTSQQGRATSGRWALGSVGAVQQVQAESGGMQAIFAATVCDTCYDLLYVRGGTIFRKIGSAGQEVVLAPGEQPAWSADGQRIAFVRYGTFAPDIYLMDDDGANMTRLTTSTDILTAPSSPSWSPDGQKLAVATGFDDMYVEGDVYTLSVSEPGSTPVRIATMAIAPAWSPDGSKIAYVSTEQFDLWVMNSDGSGKVELAAGNLPAGGVYSSPAWAPDGQRIAVTRCDYPGSCAIYEIDVASLVATRLTYGFEPTWSPDGGRIALTEQWGGPFGDLTVVAVAAADGSGTRTDVANGHSAAWRP